jgi:hypothetical protein
VRAICQPHFERAGVKVPARHLVSGLPMCSSCFDGKPIEPTEKIGAWRRNRAARRKAEWITSGRCSATQ